MKIAVLNSNGVQTSRNGKIKYYYSVDDGYDFGGNSATDVTNIDNIELFKRLLRICYCTFREMLTVQYNDLDYNSMSSQHKTLLAKHLISSKVRTDVYFDDEEQKELAVDIQKKIIDCKKNRALTDNASDLINNLNGINDLSGEFSNYKEMFNGFDGEYNGVWHKITLNVSPNSVVMVSVYCTKGTRKGGIREVGSTLDRTKQIKQNSAFSTPVRVDGNGQVEVYRQNEHITFSITAQLS
jgi:hypothetical protein